MSASRRCAPRHSRKRHDLRRRAADFHNARMSTDMTSPAAGSAADQLLRILGDDCFLRSADDVAPFLTDHRKLYRGRALGVAVPRSVEQISKLLAFCNQERIGVVPQGGNTGYCGGATPDESGQQIVLALARLKRIRS